MKKLEDQKENIEIIIRSNTKDRGGGCCVLGQDSEAITEDFSNSRVLFLIAFPRSLNKGLK